MRYILRKAVIAQVPIIEITESEYSELLIARNILINALAIEEKYEIVISNYLDFEQEIMRAATTSMIREHIDYSDFFNVRLGLNIKMVNLLTAVRLYTDQLNQNVADCLPSISDVKKRLKELFSTEYDANPYYRFMEALRNYVQHRGIPVHWAQIDSRWTSLEEDGNMEYSINVASQRMYLEEDPKMKKSVLAELDEQIDLKAATRSYIESISRVQESAREMISETVTESRRLIENTHQKYSEEYSGSIVGLSACIMDNDIQVSSVPLLLDWDNIRISLLKRNRKLVNLSKRYSTGAVRTYNK